jgi:lipoprotein NlpD
VAGILTGTLPLDSIRTIDSLAHADANYEIPRGKAESEFVKKFEEEEKYNLSVLTPNSVPTEGAFFYKPVSGVISSHYEALNVKVFWQLWMVRLFLPVLM